jgi:uncharacterized membrane protein
LRRIAWTLPIIFGTLLLSLVMTAPRLEDVSGLPRVSNDAVLAITSKHCVMCHAERPTHEAFTEAPKGTRLESIEDLRRLADPIYKQAVATRAMPIGNETGMTDEERRTLGIWLRQNQ